MIIHCNRNFLCLFLNNFSELLLCEINVLDIFDVDVFFLKKKRFCYVASTEVRPSVWLRICIRAMLTSPIQI